MEIAPGTLIQKKYRLEKKIGEGSSSIVYKAQDIDIDKPYALKFLRKELSSLPSRRKFFLTEAKIVASLRHPSIVSIRGTGEWEQTLYLVMDYYPDQSLKELMKRRLLSLEEIREISSQMLQGLKEAHQHGLVHGDIKPANLMLKKQGKHWKLGIVDFGMASYDPSKGTKGGTPFYMAPEQLFGGKGNQAGDLYSSALCIYQMITGQLPIKAKSIEELIYRLLQEEPLAPSRFRKIPRLLDKVLLQALALEPEARYKNIQEFQEALDIAWNSYSFFSWKQLALFTISLISLFFIFLFFHHYEQEKQAIKLLQEAKNALFQDHWGTSQKYARDVLSIVKENQESFFFFPGKTALHLEEEARSILWQILWKEFFLSLQNNQREKAQNLLQDKLFSSPEGQFLHPYLLFYYEEYVLSQCLKEKNYKQALEICQMPKQNILHKRLREKQANRFQLRKQIAPIEEWIEQKNASQAKLYLARIRHLLPLELIEQLEKE